MDGMKAIQSVNNNQIIARVQKSANMQFKDDELDKN